MRAPFIVLVLLGAFACNCNGAAPCTTSAQCGERDVCLQIRQCAPSCAANASACLTGEKCSAGGGCIANGSCGDDRDCTTGQLCQLGTCSVKCTANSCGAGATCEADGHCQMNTSSGGDGGEGLDGGDSCGGQLFNSTHVQANFLIVLDHSGSMMEKINGVAKWTAAVGAIKSITSQYQSQIRFGLSIFSEATMCDPGMNFVPVGDMTAPAISTALPATANGQGTPIGAALHLAGMQSGLMDPMRANFVMLVTDGKENCGGDPVAEAKALSLTGIKTFVVGFGGDVDTTTLTNTAVEGGTARNTTPRYYQADNQADLNAAFSSIAQGAVGCDFRLAQAPPDPDKIYVYVNGQLIPRDPNRTVGWEYTSGTDRITLYGTVCDAVANDPNAKVNIVYGCPDTSIIEGGGDGGTIDLDAGIIIN